MITRHVKITWLVKKISRILCCGSSIGTWSLKKDKNRRSWSVCLGLKTKIKWRICWWSNGHRNSTISCQSISRRRCLGRGRFGSVKIMWRGGRSPKTPIFSNSILRMTWERLFSVTKQSKPRCKQWNFQIKTGTGSKASSFSFPKFSRTSSSHLSFAERRLTSSCEWTNICGAHRRWCWN